MFICSYTSQEHALWTQVELNNHNNTIAPQLRALFPSAVQFFPSSSLHCPSVIACKLFCFLNDVLKIIAIIITEGPEGIKWELGIAYFGLGEWRSLGQGFIGQKKQ